jgi:hypothetical protein
MLHNTNYFIPIVISIDSDESSAFSSEKLPAIAKPYQDSKSDIRHIGKPGPSFPKTIQHANKLLNQIGLKVFNTTMFLSGSNVMGRNIHCDGMVDSNHNLAMLEARLNLYEMSSGESLLEWWDSLPNSLPIKPGVIDESVPWWQVPQMFPGDAYSHHRVGCHPPYRKELENGTIPWSDVPAPDFTINLTGLSGFVRTNIPHHIIQNNGVRVTLSLSLAFIDGTLTGVWDHIRNNIHLIEQ